MKIGNKEVKKSKTWFNYCCSEDGRVFRINTKKEMKQNPHGISGYLSFRGCHNNKPENLWVHKIVAECWVENPNSLLCDQVNHKDGNKINNHKDNLEWVTASQNQQHALKTGLKQSTEDLYNSALTNNEVHRVCQMLEDGMRPIDIAKVFNVSKDVISKIKSGDTYFTIRTLYNINHNWRNSFSESTVRWCCEMINKGLSDHQISKKSTNDLLKPMAVKHIRYKIRYKIISDEYF